MKYLGITMGDPAGIGPEISLKVLDKNEEYRNCSIIYGSISILEYYKEIACFIALFLLEWCGDKMVFCKD